MITSRTDISNALKALRIGKYSALEKSARLTALKKSYECELALDSNSGPAFTQYAADEMNLSVRSIQMYLKSWKGLTRESRARCKGTFLENQISNLTKLAAQKSYAQTSLLDMLLEDNPLVKTVADAIALKVHGSAPTYVERKIAKFDKLIGDLSAEKFILLMSAHPNKVAALINYYGDNDGANNEE